MLLQSPSPSLSLPPSLSLSLSLSLSFFLSPSPSPSLSLKGKEGGEENIVQCNLDYPDPFVHQPITAIPDK